MTKVNYSGRAVSTPIGLLIGTSIALLIILMGAALTAKSIDMELINEDKIGYSIMINLIIAACIGSIISMQKIKRQKILVCLLNALSIYGSLLLITMLFFGRQYEGVGETGLLILCGSMLPTMLNINNKRRIEFKRKKVRNR